MSRIYLGATGIPVGCSMIKERRKYERYNTEVKIYFRVNYDLKTKVKFQVADKFKERLLAKKYPGLSRNVSAEGLGFSSDKKLKKGDYLYLEVYLPKQKEPVFMQGEARWSKPAPAAQKSRYKFDAGVKLTYVAGTPVSESIHLDKKHGVIWSIVLDSIFGNFRRLMRHSRKKPSPAPSRRCGAHQKVRGESIYALPMV